MLNWKKETAANGTIQWAFPGNLMEISLFQSINAKPNEFVYKFQWGTGEIMDCHWQESITAENWSQAKTKAILKTKHIVASYLWELQDAMSKIGG